MTKDAPTTLLQDSQFDGNRRLRSLAQRFFNSAKNDLMQSGKCFPLVAMTNFEESSPVSVILFSIHREGAASINSALRRQIEDGGFEIAITVSDSYTITASEVNSPIVAKMRSLGATLEEISSMGFGKLEEMLVITVQRKGYFATIAALYDRDGEGNVTKFHEPVVIRNSDPDPLLVLF